MSIATLGLINENSEVRGCGFSDRKPSQLKIFATWILGRNYEAFQGGAKIF